jgi:hypothetical protein
MEKEEVEVSRNKVLFVGDTDLLTKYGVIKSSRFFCLHCSAILKMEPKYSQEGMFEVVEHTLKTKYYTANIKFWIMNSLKIDGKTLDIIGENCEAIVFVVDFSQVFSP